jgi:hypothetical protein
LGSRPGRARHRATNAPTHQHGFLETDGGMMFIGEKAERKYGRRNLTELLASLTTPPDFTVLMGRAELRHIDGSILCQDLESSSIILLGGRAGESPISTESATGATSNRLQSAAGHVSPARPTGVELRAGEGNA